MDDFEKAKLAKTMEDYDPERSCVKCKNDDYAKITTVYNAGHSCNGGCSMSHPEHFVRTCLRCHYQWIEGVVKHNPLDDLQDSALDLIKGN